MRVQIVRPVAFLLVALFLVGFCISEGEAQQRRRRRPSRRATNPVVTPAPMATPTPTANTNTTSATDPRIISTAADDSEQTTTRRTRRPRTTESDQESMRRTVDRLSTQVTQLTDKIGQMEQQQRTLVDMERLSRAETRAENLRAQLRDVQSKEADLEARLDQVQSDLRPENIERSVATFGSTRPEDVRADRRRQLENEQTRLQSQLQLLATSRIRLESAIANADADVDTLRARLDAPTASAPGTTTTTTNTETTPTPQPTTPAHGPSTDTEAAPSVTPR